MRSLVIATVLLGGCRTPPLELRDLSHADLSRADLSYTDLSHANDLAICPPPEVPTRQRVYFRVTNNADSVRFLATASGGCSYIGVSGLPLLTPTQCLCECAGLLVGATKFLPLPPGGVLESSWEARTYAICSARQDCSAFGLPEQIIQTGSLQPLAPGSYRVTWAAEKQLPAGCIFDGYEWGCSLDLVGSVPNGSDTSCPSGAPAEGALTLPPSGDVIVELTLS